ncbi:MAG: N-formylglutamate amidohydrolase [Pseudomonadota bacterium]
MSRLPYRLTRPDAPTTCVVVASPHSGRAYDWAFLSSSVLDSEGIRSSEDAYVDELFADVPQMGAPLLAAEMPRAYLDLNRAEGELDPAVVHGVPRGPNNPRITSGLGVIPRVVAQGRAIYRGKITRDEAQSRIETVWRPYHNELQGLMDEAQARFGRAILFDCHSMPHEAIEGAGPRGRTPEIVLGDRFGASASADVTDAVEAVFAGLGFRVARNVPFAGAYVTQAYGQPELGRHAIQIEIDRALYMDEASVQKSQDFNTMRNLMTEAMAQLCDLGRGGRALAAE